MEEERKEERRTLSYDEVLSMIDEETVKLEAELAVWSKLKKRIVEMGEEETETYEA